MKVLITDSCSYKTIAIAKYLKENYPGIYIISTGSKPYQKNILSRYINRFFLLPKPSQQDYLTALKAIINTEKPDVFIPVNSKEINPLMKQKGMFAPLLDYVGNYETYNALNDKGKLYHIAEQNGIKVPVHYTSVSSAVIPFVIKPRVSSSSVGVHYIKSEADRASILASKKNEAELVIQQYVEGEGVGYSVFCKNGEILKGYGHKRIMEFPASGGSSVYRQQYDNPEMIAITKKLLLNTGWSGFGMFEFKITSNNELYLIEVNPRVWGSINQGLQNNCNYFEPLLGATGQSVGTAGNNTYLSPLIYLSALSYLFKGKISKAFSFFNTPGNNKADVSFFNDPLGWLSILLKI